MATHNITITYPDGASARIMAALKAKYNVQNNAQALAAFNQEVKDQLKAIVFMYERRAAAVAAENAVAEPEIT